MIDLESDMVTQVYNALVEDYPDILVTSEPEFMPQSFPTVFIEQIDGYMDKSKITSSRIERFNILTFDINVFSNKTSGRKAEAKDIMEKINEVFRINGFTRTSLYFVDLTDTSRYTDSIDKTKVRLFSRYNVGVTSTGYTYPLT